MGEIGLPSVVRGPWSQSPAHRMLSPGLGLCADPLAWLFCGEGLPWEGGPAPGLSKALGESSHLPQTAPRAKPATELCWDSSLWPWGGGWLRDRCLVLTPRRTRHQDSPRDWVSSPASLGAPTPTGCLGASSLDVRGPRCAHTPSGTSGSVVPTHGAHLAGRPGLPSLHSGSGSPVTRTGRRHPCSPRPRPLSGSREAGPGASFSLAGRQACCKGQAA